MKHSTKSALTKAQKHLIAGLILFGVEEEAILGIMMGLDTPKLQDSMMEYLDENRNATTSDILKKMVELRKGQ